MTFAFYHLWILCVWIEPVFTWMHPKCYIYDTEDEKEAVPLCLGYSGYTAVCNSVKSIEEDLTGLPPGLNNI